ncbi:hypothetical protein Daudx_0535 [Candidatus Desulforudis audaxviator]|nr:hypothetical protein Daudx_0535 [Candidatus Desulforudis audaxviator]
MELFFTVLMFAAARGIPAGRPEIFCIRGLPFGRTAFKI